MVVQDEPERDLPPAKPDKEIKVAIEKARAEAKASQARAKAEERARLKAEKTLAEAQETLEAIKIDLEQERQIRIKAEQARSESEQALAEAINAAQVVVESSEREPEEHEEEVAERRTSFILRLTVDDRGQPKRTEVEHSQSGKKESFPYLDVQRVASFIQVCINPQAFLEHEVLSSFPSTRVEVPKAESPMPVTSLAISDGNVFRLGSPGFAALTVDSDEKIVVQIRFHLDGPEASALANQGFPFEVYVYTHEITTGGSKLLTTYQANLKKNVLNYTVQMLVLSLSPGKYRLHTMVILHSPTKLESHYDGPIIQAVKLLSTAYPATPSRALLVK